MLTPDVIQRLREIEQRLALLESIEGFDDVFRTYTDATRGAAGSAGRVIYNSTDGKLNIDNGTNWTLPDGTVT